MSEGYEDVVLLDPFRETGCSPRPVSTIRASIGQSLLPLRTHLETLRDSSMTGQPAISAKLNRLQKVAQLDVSQLYLIRDAIVRQDGSKVHRRVHRRYRAELELFGLTSSQFVESGDDVVLVRFPGADGGELAEEVAKAEDADWYCAGRFDDS